MYAQLRPALTYSPVAMVREGTMPFSMQDAWDAILNDIRNSPPVQNLDKGRGNDDAEEIGPS